MECCQGCEEPIDADNDFATCELCDAEGCESCIEDGACWDCDDIPPVSGGAPEDNPDDDINPDHLSIEEWEGADDKFALRVIGDNMLPDHIADGDYVIIDKAKQPEEGEIVAVRDADGDAKLGRFYRFAPGSMQMKHGMILIEQSANPGDRKPRNFKDVVGVLVGVVRKY